MGGINYEDLELRALAHIAIGYGPRMKSVFVGREAMRELSRRQAVYHEHEWDPAPPLCMGPQRCLSSRETIERLAFVLPKPKPTLTPKEASALLSAWWSEYPAAREYLPERTKTRAVWMGGDYIDDGTGRPPTKEEAAERWRQVREAIVEASKRYPTDPESARLLREETLYGSRTYYPPHTRDTKPRG